MWHFCETLTVIACDEKTARAPSTRILVWCWSTLQYVAVCCGMLQYVAVCCSMLQYVAVCWAIADIRSALNTYHRVMLRMLQNVAACCSTLQYVAVCCSVLQQIAMCCNVLQSHPWRKRSCWTAIADDKGSFNTYHRVRLHMMQYVAVCCSMLQYVAVCCSVLQCVAVCCSMLQCVAVSPLKEEVVLNSNSRH